MTIKRETMKHRHQMPIEDLNVLIEREKAMLGDLGQAIKTERKRDEVPTALWVPVDELMVDAYQRPLREAKLQEWGQNGWNPRMAGAITINMREDGTMPVLDGHHRLTLARRLGIQEILCICWDGLVYKEEAHIFRRSNSDRANPKSVELFNSALEEEDPDALAIRETVERMGYHINLGNKTTGLRVISAVEVLQRIYDFQGTEGIRNTLSTVKRLWPETKEASNGVVLKSVWGFLYKHGDEMSYERFVQKIGVQSIARLQQKASEFRVTDSGVTPEHALYLAMLHYYNRNLGTTLKLLPKRIARKRGERNANSKLNDAQLREMRRLWRDEVSHDVSGLQALGLQFGLSDPRVRAYVNNRERPEVQPE